MTGAAARRRGAPLMMLAAVLGCWVVLRSVLGFAVYMPEAIAASAAPLTRVVTADAPSIYRPLAEKQKPEHVVTSYMQRERTGERVARLAKLPAFTAHVLPLPALAQTSAPPIQQSRIQHNARPAADALPALVRTSTPSRRLSADTWLVLREGGHSEESAAFRTATLGGSQIGAVVRHDLLPGTRASTSAYLRASRALAENGESEAAVGLALRPSSEVPVTFHAEARVMDSGSRTVIRPAAFVTAGLQTEVGAVSVRAYAQAGYVAGEFATAFADGQLVAEHSVAETGSSRFRLGAGAWGGAQEGASRLDIGPVASVEAKVAGTPLRIEASYRQKVGGAAQPESGLALTVSAGF